MVNTWGQWTEEKDYSTYPKDKWCDLDYVANYIREQNYQPKIDIEELSEYIIYNFCEDEQYAPHYGDDLMIYMPNLIAFVEDSGGVKEFDYRT